MRCHSSPHRTEDPAAVAADLASRPSSWREDVSLDGYLECEGAFFLSSSSRPSSPHSSSLRCPCHRPWPHNSNTAHLAETLLYSHKTGSVHVSIKKGRLLRRGDSLAGAGVALGLAGEPRKPKRHPRKERLHDFACRNAVLTIIIIHPVYMLTLTGANTSMLLAASRETEMDEWVIAVRSVIAEHNRASSV